MIATSTCVILNKNNSSTTICLTDYGTDFLSSTTLPAVENGLTNGEALIIFFLFSIFLFLVFEFFVIKFLGIKIHKEI